MPGAASGLCFPAVVTRGHHLSEYRSIIEANRVDLVVTNTQDEGQLADQVVAWIELLGKVDILPGQELARLDLHEGAGHHQEVPEVGQIHLLENLEVAEILAENIGDPHLVDVHFLLLHKM